MQVFRFPTGYAFKLEDDNIYLYQLSTRHWIWYGNINILTKQFGEPLPSSLLEVQVALDKSEEMVRYEIEEHCVKVI